MIRAAILTVSDSAAAGTRDDLSGPALAKRCEELSWPIVASRIVPDVQTEIAAILSEWADSSVASLILTTGGTGISARDVTPEATRAILDREIPGLSEVMRSKGLEQSRFAPLSRALVGTRKRAVIVNLPGSPRGAVFSLNVLHDLLPHVIDLLEGRTAH